MAKKRHKGQFAIVLGKKMIGGMHLQNRKMDLTAGLKRKEKQGRRGRK
jgi:hypothetical protein